MTSIRRSRKALIGLAAFASVAAILPFTNTAQAALPRPLPPGAPAAGVATLIPASGTNATNFALSLPALSACPGDGINGYRFGTYIMPITSDPASTLFDGTGSPIGPPVTSSLRNPSGTFVRGLTPGAGDGLIAMPAAGLSWVGLGPLPGILPAGAYNIGVVCTLNDLDPVNPEVENTRFWNNQITVTSTGSSTFTWEEGVFLPPLAPVLEADADIATTATSATVDFTHDNVIPATEGFTATVTPFNPAGAALPDIIVPAGATSFTATGLTTGTQYTATLVARNATGSSPVSNLATFRVTQQCAAPVVNAPDAFERAAVTITWAAPTPCSAAPDSYDVVIFDTPDSGPATAVQTFTGVTTTNITVPASAPAPAAVTLPIDGYEVRVTPNFDPADGVGAPAGIAGFDVTPNTLLYQDITVERPAGALVLTQRCGVFGAFPAFDTTGWPGAQLTLDPVVAVGGAGTAPTLVNALGNDTGTPDPLFTSYPQRGTYPTLCGVNLGAGELVTAGPLAGRYYVADGSINQVTVLDTRDGDLGWTAKGDIADRFTSGPGTPDANNSFSGDFLGWFPQVTSWSTGQSVTAGPAVSPGTTGGLTGNPTLASAPLGAGLGIATLDARLAVIIPVAADADTYTARLSLTVA